MEESANSLYRKENEGVVPNIIHSSSVICDIIPLQGIPLLLSPGDSAQGDVQNHLQAICKIYLPLLRVQKEGEEEAIAIRVGRPITQTSKPGRKPWYPAR